MFAKYLPEFGWNPIVLTVDEKYYEEKPDLGLNELIPHGQRVERVSAFSLTKPRLIGDVGLRAFFQLKKKAFEIISKEQIDFVYIFIPSFYLSLLGPLLHKKFGVKYGIDYIDPWVHFFPGSEKNFSRHWWSTWFSKVLEPYAISKAALITGVSEGYYNPIFERNPQLKSSIKTLALPYGWDGDELKHLKNFENNPPSFVKSTKLQLVYAGALLPKSAVILESFFAVIKNNIADFKDVEFHFIGTGKTRSSNKSVSIKTIATEMGLFETVIFEHPNRIPYLDVLNSICSSSGVFILGSTESHYTPSKLFNAFTTRKPIFAILNENSSAKQIIESAEWGIVCSFNEENSQYFQMSCINQFRSWKEKTINNNWNFNIPKANELSVNKLTNKLAEAFNSAL
jgi:hypothetical protein